MACAADFVSKYKWCPGEERKWGIWNRLLGRLLSRFSCFVIFACVQVCVQISKGGDSLPNDYNSPPSSDILRVSLPFGKRQAYVSNYDEIL